MKIKTNLLDLEIEIKAKGLHNPERYNKDDLMSFLNELSLMADTAAAHYTQKEGRDALAKQAKCFADLLYKICEENNTYNI